MAAPDAPRHRAPHGHPPRVTARARAVLLVVAVALVAAVGVGLGVAAVGRGGSATPGAAGTAPGSAGATRSPGTTSPGATAVGTSPGTVSPGTASPSLQIPVDPSTAAAPAGTPVSLSVPAIGVSTDLQRLGLLSDRTLQSPTQWGVAGWYAGGTRPGDVGPAVIAGHVDSVNGPAVFFRLRELRSGDHVSVRDSTGRVHRFTVTTVQQFPKNQFPTGAVYGPTPLPELRLITCTGDFDYSKRSYVDNLVVTAVLDGRRVN